MHRSTNFIVILFFPRFATAAFQGNEEVHKIFTMVSHLNQFFLLQLFHSQFRLVGKINGIKSFEISSRHLINK